jgi:hypothetical protein
VAAVYHLEIVDQDALVLDVRRNPAAPSRASATDVGVVAARGDVEQNVLASLVEDGVITVTSGRCVPPLNGAFSTKTSPGASCPGWADHGADRFSPIEPRWTGTCGALATSPPVGSNSAQEKS